MADALKLSFGIITTDRRRPYQCNSMMNSAILDPVGLDGMSEDSKAADEIHSQQIYTHEGLMRTQSNNIAESNEQDFARPRATSNVSTGQSQEQEKKPTRPERPRAATNLALRNRLANGSDMPSSPLHRSTRIDSIDSPELPKPGLLQRNPTAIGVMTPNADEDGYESPGGDEDEDEVCLLLLPRH